MNTDNTIDIALLTQRSEEVLKKIEDILKRIEYPTDGMPTDIYNHEKPINVVFVGQFSAGKSTIIKALTGIKDIVIGSGIQTKETHVYDWNDIQVIDTPGIHTGLRPDHDEITYDAIAKADMLVYVITQELFDDNIGQNFRKLLLEKGKAREMILVVNKMEDIGNTETNREIKRNDLCKVTEPYTPEDLRTVFIDARTYLDSLEEPDQELSEEFKLRSNYDELVKTLNAFIKENGIAARLTTALYIVFKQLEDAIKKNRSTTEDDDIDMIEEQCLRERHIISDTCWRVELSVKSIYKEAASKIRTKGNELANTIHDCASEEEANKITIEAYNAVNEISQECEESIVKKIAELSDDSKAKLDDFYNSHLIGNLQLRLKKQNNGGNPIIDRFLKSDLLSQGSSKILSSTIGLNPTANGLKAFTGSEAHGFVLNIGHYFGHSFKPWEAVKWVKKINYAGKAVGIFGVVFSWGMQAKEEMEDEKKKIEMRENREHIRAAFNDAANAVENHYNAALQRYLNENFRNRIDKIDATIADIRMQRKNKTETYNILVQAQEECRLLISDIHDN